MKGQARRQRKLERPWDAGAFSPLTAARFLTLAFGARQNGSPTNLCVFVGFWLALSGRRPLVRLTEGDALGYYGAAFQAAILLEQSLEHNRGRVRRMGP